MKKYFISLLLLSIHSLLLYSCSNSDKAKSNLELSMNSIAESYVKLVLKVGQLDTDYVDAYYGPEEWRTAASSFNKADTTVYEKLTSEADSLLTALEALGSQKATELEKLRYRYLYKQIVSAKVKLLMLSGILLGFDEEAKGLYDVEVPQYSEEFFQKIIDELNAVLPGSGSTSERLSEFKKAFIIPKEKLDTVFSAAIDECRRRTARNVKLTEGENFTVEYVSDKPWGAYNWYKGNSFSLIQVNTDLPVYIDRAIDLAAHEGYPGHHLYNSLLEKKMVKENGWMEFSVYPLFSPQSLIAEGSANYGIEVAFPGESRINFEKEILFPLAGLDASKAGEYYKVLELMHGLSYANNHAARNYIDGSLTREETKLWLQKFAMRTPEQSEKSLQFIDKYRSYVINYNLGQDIIKDYIERNGGTADDVERRWKLFENLLSTPQTPSNLQRDSD